jgi:hypothetical protein
MTNANACRTLLVLFLAVSANAQVSASLSGTVTDPSVAVVSGAAVTAKNTNTGAIRDAVTDSTGHYELLALPLGQFEISVRKAGFSATVRKGVRLVVGQNATVDLSLQLAQANQQVTIDADAPPVSVTTADISGVVGEEQVKDLPLNGRSYDELLTLNPGIVNFTSMKTGGIGVSNSTSGNNFAVNGNRPQQNLFLLNGIEFTGAAENNMQPGGVSQQLLGVDAVLEFNVLRDSYDASYGKRPGAQVAIVTQSGANQIHGSLFEFLRNNDLDARNFFDGASVPGFQRNQYGGSIGAPIKKDKTFVFSNFEGFNQHLHQTGVDLVPDANARLGFLPCKLVTPAPNPCPASGLAQVGATVSPLINAWPVPSPGAPDFGGISEAFNNPLQTIRDDFSTIRLDQIFSAKDTLSASYTTDSSADFTPTSTNSYSTDAESLHEQVASIEETHVFSPTMLNTARVGFSRAGYFFTGEPTPGTPAASLPGFITGEPVGAIVVGGSAASNPTAQLSLAGSNNGSNLHLARNLFTYDDKISITLGRHQISIGLWYQRLQSNETLALSQFGQATFTSVQTFLAGTVATLLYDPTPTAMHWRSWFGAGYIEDKIRLSQGLTLSLGLRNEFSTGYNSSNGQASNYNYVNGVILPTPTVGNSVFAVNNAQVLLQPRVGLAWSPSHTNKTVIRAGFGIYNDLQDALGYRTDQNAPFNPTYSVPNVPVASLPLSTSATIPATAHLVPGGVQPNLQTPTLISWSLRLQQQLTANTALTVGYIGSHGYHEILGIDGNEPFPVICPASPCPANYPVNFPAPLAGSPIPAGTYYVPTATKPTPSLANTWTYFSEATSSYNALQVDLNHRFSSGFSVRGVYTWSKTIDDGDSLNATTSGGEPALASNPFNLLADKGLANFDVRNAAAINATYALPVGHGKMFAGNATGYANALISGWTVNSIVTLQGGFPFTPQLSYNPSNNGDTRNPVRPFVNPLFTGSVIEGNPNQWFNPAAFLAPPNASGFYGNEGRDNLLGPGLATWDFSVFKDTAIRERMKLQFRAEFFNILNRANFNTPNAVTFTPTGVSPTAGIITSTSTTSRQIQFGLKLLF